MSKLTMEQAGAIIGISRQAIYQRIDSGLLPRGVSPEDAVRLEVKRLRREADIIERRLATFTEAAAVMKSVIGPPHR